MIRVGVTGGIGSGKSAVCAMFAQKGIAVYDSDSRAKVIMTDDAVVRAAVMAAFGAESYGVDGLDRQYLAAQVFSDTAKIQLLNSIVHPAVARDFEQWCDHQEGDYVVIEAAVLFEAGFDKLVDVTVAVVAPEPLRLQRACERDGVTAEKIKARMARQLGDDELVSRADFAIVNISLDDVQRDVDELDSRLRRDGIGILKK